MQNYIILTCGFPWSWKSTYASFLKEKLWYTRLDTVETRKQMWYTEYDEWQTSSVLKVMYQNLIASILDGKWVILEAVYKSSRWRQSVYNLANDLWIETIILECVCSESTAKARMKERMSSESAISSPSDPAVYDKYKNIWENPLEDLNKNNWKVLIRFNTETWDIHVYDNSYNIKTSQFVKDFIDLLENYFLEINYK